MDRYQFVHKTKSNAGKRIYSTSRYPVSYPAADDIYMYARDGMRLDNLAYKYYGDAGLWWIIALANNIGKGTLVVPLGTQIRIPKTSNSIIKNLEDAQNNV